MFRPAYLCEDWLGIATNENHTVFKWSGGDVFFSCCQKGEAVSVHFSAGKYGLRIIKPALNEFCAWIFESLPWCRMILACIVRPSVTRLAAKCGFIFLESQDDLQLYVRVRKWEV